MLKRDSGEDRMELELVKNEKGEREGGRELALGDCHTAPTAVELFSHYGIHRDT